MKKTDMQLLADLLNDYRTIAEAISKDEAIRYIEEWGFFDRFDDLWSETYAIVQAAGYPQCGFRKAIWCAEHQVDVIMEQCRASWDWFIIATLQREANDKQEAFALMEQFFEELRGYALSKARTLPRPQPDVQQIYDGFVKRFYDDREVAAEEALGKEAWRIRTDTGVNIFLKYLNFVSLRLTRLLNEWDQTGRQTDPEVIYEQVVPPVLEAYKNELIRTFLQEHPWWRRGRALSDEIHALFAELRKEAGCPHEWEIDRSITDWPMLIFLIDLWASQYPYTLAKNLAKDRTKSMDEIMQQVRRMTLAYLEPCREYQRRLARKKAES